MVFFKSYYRPLFVIFVLVIGTVLWRGYLTSRSQTLRENHCALVRGRSVEQATVRIDSLVNEPVSVPRWSYSLVTIVLNGVAESASFSFRLEDGKTNDFLDPENAHYRLDALHDAFAQVGEGEIVEIGYVYNDLVGEFRPILVDVNGVTDFGTCNRFSLAMQWVPGFFLTLWTLIFGGISLAVLLGKTRVASRDQLAQEALDEWDGRVD